MGLIELLLLGSTIVSAGQSFECTPTRVWDGDGPIWCAEGPRIRLSGIAAREMDGSCSPGHPCPKASAEAARDALVKLVGTAKGRSREGHVLVSGPTLLCRSVGGAGGKRTAAWCVSPKSGDLSCAMVKGGWALKWSKYWKTHRCNG
jgi:endonuclease YncB( thermonuclease family)